MERNLNKRDFFIFVAFTIIFVIPVKSFAILVKSFESIKKAFHKCIFLHGEFRGGLRELFREITTLYMIMYFLLH